MSKPAIVLVCLGLALLCGVMIDRKSPPAQVTAGQKPAPVVANREQPACDIPLELTEAHYLDPQRQAMERHLRKPISIELREQPLKEALRQIEAKTSVRLVPDPDLRDTGSEEAIDAPVSVMAKDVPLKQVLSRMLSPLSLIALPDGNEVHILDATHFCGRLSTKIYPVADLIAYRADNQVQLVREGLVAFLTSIIQPESWDEVGGPGSIAYEPITMSFAIRQTDAVHDAIDDSLRTLREARCRMPKLLQAAGALSVDEIRSAEDALTRASLELNRIEKDLRALEGGDPKKAPNGSGGGFGAGGGFFDVVNAEAGQDVKDLSTGLSRSSVAAEARKLAVRAIRIALRFEQAIEDENRKQSAPAEQTKPSASTSEQPRP